MNEIKPINYFKFFIGTVFFGLVLLTSGTISTKLGLDAYPDMVIKFIVIAAILFYAYKRDEINRIFNIHFSPVYLLVIVIPVVISIIMQNCELNFKPYPIYIVSTVVATIATALWEELYFRYVGCSLFEEENGKYRWYNILFMALMFVMIHLINIAFNGLDATYNQLIFTFGLAIFCLALYIETKSLLVPIIAHFCINSVADFFTLYSSNMPAYVGDLQNPLLYLDVIIMVIIGVYILKKNDHII
ncbi:CPBP family intramembrane glutamic endopeptidase [Methanobrevibacter sp.]